MTKRILPQTIPLFLLLITTPALAQSSLMTGEDLRAFLPNTTLGATGPMGMQMRMTFEPDGTLAASAGLMRMSGNWSIEADKLCIDTPRQRADVPRCQVFERTATGMRSAQGTDFTIER